MLYKSNIKMDEILDEKNYETRKIIFASFLERLGAFLIDIFLLLAVSFGYYLQFSKGVGNYKFFLLTNWWILLIVFTLYSIFFTGSERNATLGMQIMNIRMLTDKKRDIDFTTATIHFLLSIFFFFSFFSLLSQKKQPTLADKYAKVFVVRV